MARLLTKSNQVIDFLSNQLSRRNARHFWETQENLESSNPLLQEPPENYNSLNISDLPPLSRSVTVAENEQSGEAIKLGTFEGCFIPTTLNVLSILLYLRFPWIVGEAGVLKSLLMLVISYTIGFLTSLSISAICTNGMVRGGGAYYAVSRSIGPEMGGSIGFIFYIGQILNTGMNISGFVEPVIGLIGKNSGTIIKLFPEGFWWNFAYTTVVLILCCSLCCLGSATFARASNALFFIIILSTISIPISAILVRPFKNPSLDLFFTGVKLSTLTDNLFSSYTKDLNTNIQESFKSTFGVFFPASAGLLAGASMSGDLKAPSRAIPKGTLSSLFTTFLLYLTVILCIGASVTRSGLLFDMEVLEHISLHPLLIISGILASGAFSSFMGIFGAAKLLQAIARDDLIPGLFLFAKGSGQQDIPFRAILLTYFITQISLYWDINMLSSMITMTFLLTFGFINLACLLLRLSSTPNFRPTFSFFNRFTTGFGCVLSFGIMFYIDRINAFASFLIAGLLIFVIYFTSPPKNWGDVSQGIIYHQLRKYLLHTNKAKENIKYWRPQILLLVNNPNRSENIIRFCNSLKKGSLYILGHVIVSKDFQGSMEELRKQQQLWHEFILERDIKGFVDLTVAPDEVWGIRGLISSAGLGGIRPNIAVLTFINTRYKKIDAAKRKSLKDDDDSSSTEDMTESQIAEHAILPVKWVQILEDILAGLVDVMVTYGFDRLQWPQTKGTKRYIDMFPVHMASNLESNRNKTRPMYATNLETYTMVFQLSWILHTSPEWKQGCTLRLLTIVEHEDEIEAEKQSLQQLLETFRMKAEIKVLCLCLSNLDAYRYILKNEPISAEKSANIEFLLKDDLWWNELSRHRNNSTTCSKSTIIQRKVSNYSFGSSSVGQLTAPPLSIPLSFRLGQSLKPDHPFTRSSMENEYYTPPKLHRYYSDSTVELPNDTPPQSPEDYDDQSIESKEENSDKDAELTFNNLSSRAQYIVMNEMIREHTENTAVLFTVLPAPHAKTHENFTKSEQYVDDLLIFMKGLPPCGLIHSKSLTITTAL
ncbi:arginine transporter Can1 [Schizosaccharomyces cryophilus OY26]|uniref:Arginine transporter Can1 n=1 Tax=Schizosaccharomyces cryophilus (strain OY26 / ATCC MYA-4695 / CBS 11777 / NBRC 106824 / NRRL Y48691) TaxID=653667 RepID=S9X764_SCHCR|nr:arginine transporter Can1 [Schizosaccharomyces cryophilus OY26]EPY52927.1 arginine transporter Can1 [Schizosaccharomyces cryophilus OY26]